MSYNYLPLDRKRLSFQQVNNLLDYDQLVSITFDAHERILKCREYVDRLPGDTNGGEDTQQQHDIIRSMAFGTGEEVPEPVVKLMLMLKIKSLGQGHSGVHIETVKRLMDMYNNAVLPVIYKQATASALSHLSLPLTGIGKVYYKGAKTDVAEAFRDLNWTPVNLQSNEALALITGTQFTSAYGMWALKKAAQLLKMADVVAALSYNAINCSKDAMNEKLFTFQSSGAAETAATISLYLPSFAGKDQPAPFSFSVTPKVHGAAKNSFQYVLNVFLQEINAVTETRLFFPENDLILNSGSSAGPLFTAMGFLSASISSMADISEKRTRRLVTGFEQHPRYKMLQNIAAAMVNENKERCTSAVENNAGVDEQDQSTTGSNSGASCIKVINNTLKVLAIELLAAVIHIQAQSRKELSPFLQQFVNDFHKKVVADENNILHDEIENALKFIEEWDVKS